MSYLNGGAANTEIKLATISLWFRIPKQSIAAAAAEFEAKWNTHEPFAPAYGIGWQADGLNYDVAYDTAPPQMAGIIPLLTFGNVGSSSNSIGYPQTFATYAVEDWYWNNPDPATMPDGVWVYGSETMREITHITPASPTETWATEPSYIGVWCTSDPPRALLAVNLEIATAARAHVVGYGQVVSSHISSNRQIYHGPAYGTPGGPPPHTYSQSVVYTDLVSPPAISQTDAFRTHPRVSDVGQYDGASDLSRPFGITVTGDEWHHLLLSFDLTTPCKTHGTLDGIAPYPLPFVDSAPKLWIAFDDENRIGRELSYYWTGKGASGFNVKPDGPDAGGPPNDILTPGAWRIAGMRGSVTPGSTSTFDSTTGETVQVTIQSTSSLPQYNLTNASVSAQPLGLPASERWVESIKQVEMAEFQMFTGIALDTASESNRRAFVDRDGKPVPADQEEDSEKGPGSIQMMQRHPDILLHTSSNWIEGHNTGADPGGFEPIGGIEKYKPDPSLDA